ncbi:MAG TPA: hypothetical protein VHG28_16850 [Longimicrobiaceae bacterium]|nr:hypothetical protein [Longimicrobiaceae bacterium]
MKQITRGFQRVVFALAVAGALGSGATQALARPATEESTARACTQCLRECGSLGGVWKSGRCLCCG